jgi:hypothetical protein
MTPQDRRSYITAGFVSGKLKWGPIALKNWQIFQDSKFSDTSSKAVPSRADIDRNIDTI